GNPQACPAQCSRDRRGGLERLRGIGHNGASRPARSPTRYRFAYGGALARSRRPDFERGGRVGMWTVMNQTGAPSANDTWRTSAPSGPERPLMQRHRPLRRRVPVWLAVTMLALAACAPAAQAPQSAVRAGRPRAEPPPAEPRRIRAGQRIPRILHASAASRSLPRRGAALGGQGNVENLLRRHDGDHLQAALERAVARWRAFDGRRLRVRPHRSDGPGVSGRQLTARATDERGPRRRRPY